jgi:hypothetical protein
MQLVHVKLHGKYHVNTGDVLFCGCPGKTAYVCVVLSVELYKYKRRRCQRARTVCDFVVTGADTRQPHHA